MQMWTISAVLFINDCHLNSLFYTLIHFFFSFIMKFGIDDKAEISLSYLQWIPLIRTTCYKNLPLIVKDYSEIKLRYM